MSRTHKPKPPDKGESAPKPSRKVAIEEVLRSLQDLVNNELSVDTSKAEPQSEPAASPAPPESPVPESGVSNRFAPNLAAAHPDTDTAPTVDFEVLPQSIPEPLPAPEPAPVTKRRLPPEGLQQELPHLEPGPAVEPPVTAATDSSSLLVETVFPAPELPGTDELEDRGSRSTAAGEGTGIERVAAPDIPNPELPAGDSPEPGPVASCVIPDTSPTGMDLRESDADDLNDIPVLEDAVDLHEELNPHASPDESALPAAVLPGAQDGRRLAIQVAARLNVELRKAGQPGLSSDVIARLAHLLEETLAKGAPNMENSAKPNH